MPLVLLTGGTGYIGSHTCVELLNAGYDTLVLDNLCNSSTAVLGRIEQITRKRPAFIRGDVRDRSVLDRIFREHSIEAVVHFAALKAVAESVARPLDYYDNNVCGSASLFAAMNAHGVRRVVFSSSATVYGVGNEMPVGETSPTAPVSPYGHTKLMVEQMLHDLAEADTDWRTMCLRYFNPVGAHESGLIGEDPQDTPNNLMPYVAQVAVGRLSRLDVFGDDYPTSDGTGVRDYIHVTDLALGHLAALQRVMNHTAASPTVINLGTGRGHSVLEVVHTFMQVSGRPIPYEVVGRRPGDIPVCFADVTLARNVLGWKAERDLDRMCADAWRWQSANPDGYAGDTASRCAGMS
jgi:UDP-glucose 4-epimerase